MVKTNVKLYETTEDYLEAISSSRSSSVTFQNMKMVFVIFFCFLTCLLAFFVLSIYVVPFFTAKFSWLLRRLSCSLNRRLRPNRPKHLQKFPRKKRTCRIIHINPPCIPVDHRRFYELEMNALRPGLLSRSIVTYDS